MNPLVLISAMQVVLIGDSHLVGPMGNHLDELIRNHVGRSSVETFSYCGSNADSFLVPKNTNCGVFEKDSFENQWFAQTGKSPGADRWLDTKPNWVIISLGTNAINAIGVPGLQKKLETDIQNLISKIHRASAKCFWIMPPDMERFRTQLPKVNLWLENQIQNQCVIFQSDRVTAYPKGEGDGIHYSSKKLIPQAKQWAQQVFDSWSKQ